MISFNDPTEQAPRSGLTLAKLMKLKDMMSAGQEEQEAKEMFCDHVFIKKPLGAIQCRYCVKCGKAEYSI